MALNIVTGARLQVARVTGQKAAGFQKRENRRRNGRKGNGGRKRYKQCCPLVICEWQGSALAGVAQWVGCPPESKRLWVPFRSAYKPALRFGPVGSV